MDGRALWKAQHHLHTDYAEWTIQSWYLSSVNKVEWYVNFVTATTTTKKKPTLINKFTYSFTKSSSVKNFLVYYEILL